jgi:superfamily II DNA or RNA helicase
LFLGAESLRSTTWQAFERLVVRLLLCEGFEGARLVGQSGDRGADVVAHRNGRRWLFQVKRWKARIGMNVVDKTLEALITYRAAVPVIVSLSGFDDAIRKHQATLHREGFPLQLWDRATLIERAARLPNLPLVEAWAKRYDHRNYQEEAITAIVNTYLAGHSRKALIVMATGLGKTYVAADAYRRICAARPARLLALAHTNPLVYQLERTFWPFLTPSQETLIWNGDEHPPQADLARSSCVFASQQTVYEQLQRTGEVPHFDMLLVDECHHAGGAMYDAILGETRAGEEHGPFLLGLTATPWRADETDIERYFGVPLVTVDLVTGLRNGFLTNVDYRMFTDNINWRGLGDLHGDRFTPDAINRKLFIHEWDDGVVLELRKVWEEQDEPRAIVFCGTIDHAVTMRDKINALGFTRAEAIFSQSRSGPSMTSYERNRVLLDFEERNTNVICVVDVFNEGIDVPDVNIIVFQRVTHSRRIFIQQLGRGLRVAEGKNKVIVLDFVSDIRRFAAGLELKDQLERDAGDRRGPVRVRLPNKVTFQRVGGEDPACETFLRQWLDDVAAIQEAGDDASVLKFPPALPGSRV